ncbi:hypothetical protein LOY56_06595 [Pseudomonas sp. B21-048]|nr:hypothetical protein LOY56_06595 [Pseudomonas sp. B21-048]
MRLLRPGADRPAGASSLATESILPTSFRPTTCPSSLKTPPRLQTSAPEQPDMSCCPRSPGGSTLRLRFGGWLLLASFLRAGLVSVWGRIEAWSQLLHGELNASEHEQLNAVNRFFNQQLSFQHSDSKKRSRWQDVLKKMQFEGLVVGEGEPLLQGAFYVTAQTVVSRHLPVLAGGL